MRFGLGGVLPCFVINQAESASDREDATMKHDPSARTRARTVVALLVGCLLGLALPAAAQDGHGRVEHEQAVAFDVSPPLRDIPHPPRRVEKREVFIGRHLRPAQPPQPDTVL